MLSRRQLTAVYLESSSALTVRTVEQKTTQVPLVLAAFVQSIMIILCSLFLGYRCHLPDNNEEFFLGERDFYTTAVKF